MTAESTEARQVLMHRVIALSGVPESAAANKPQPAKPEPKQDIDLSRTVHEWSFPQQAPSASEPQPAEPARQSQPAHNIKASAEAHWATHSSISLVACDETPLAPRILNTNLDDAVTQQYDPATTGRALGLVTSDLASLDRALESAGVLDDDEFGVITSYQPTTTPEPIISVEPPARAQPISVQPQPEPQVLQQQSVPPRMLLVPASMVWAVLTVFSLCALALTTLIIAVVLRYDLF